MKIRIISLIIIAFFISNIFVFGQSKKISISGKVTEKTGVPVESAIIFIDDERTDVTTDQKGNYKIRVRSDAKEIQVFSLSKGVAEEEINGRTVIDFILSDASGEAILQDKGEDNTKASDGDDVIQGKKLTDDTDKEIDYQDVQFSSFQNIYEMIRGRFPGVEVSGNSIKIYGSSSLNVSTEPLFVVDGVIVNSIDDINPQTVKSIEVLKGPEATAYGTRGSNGVIVITRLTGKD